MKTVTFRPTEDPPGVSVVDRITSHQYAFETPEPVSPTPVSVESFPVPVKYGVSFSTEELQLSPVPMGVLYDREGQAIDNVGLDESLSIGEGVYYLGLSTQVKTYLRISGPADIAFDPDCGIVELSGETTLTLGARAYIHRPTATVTTTPDPDDLAATISTFGGALQSTTPERAYPTLRGHPPAVELGDQFDAPDDWTLPETGIEVTVPPDVASIFAVAPLAYYLGAECTVGEEPAVRTDEGFELLLESDPLADDVEEALKRTFFLDALVRTAGQNPFNSYEYDALTTDIPFDLETAYEANPAERLAMYEEIQYEKLEEYMPQWPATAYLQPTADNVRTLPYLSYQLTLVRPMIPPTYSGTEARRVALDSFVQAGQTRGATSVFQGDEVFVNVPETESLAQLWVGEGIPLNANKPLTEGLQNREESPPAEIRDIRVEIVCNDFSMREESSGIQRVYGDREDLSFDLTTHEQLSTFELTELLGQDTDFLHYIGHATADGLQCRDGYLDPATLQSVGTKAFLLNGCQSYNHGIELIGRGSFGGIVTLSDVPEVAALGTGQLIARLLNSGHTLRSALSVARVQSTVGGQYLVVGDDETSVAQATNGAPSLLRVESVSDEEFKLKFVTFPAPGYHIGTTVHPVVSEGERYLGATKTFTLTESELRSVLELAEDPIEFDGELTWASDLLEEL